MTVTDKEIKAVNRRVTEEKAASLTAVSVRYDRRVPRVVITLATGLELAFSPKHAQGLEHAHPADLADAEINPSGLGIHFPRLDADIYIRGFARRVPRIQALDRRADRKDRWRKQE